MANKKIKNTVSSNQKPLPKQVLAKPGAIKQAVPPPLGKFKTDRVKIIAAILVIGLLSSVIYHYYQIQVLDRDYYPYNTFLFAQNDRFNDFNNIYPFSINLDPYNHIGVYGMRGNYFPFTFLILRLFNFLPIQISLYTFLFSFTIFFVFYVYKNIPEIIGIRRYVFTFIFTFSYPFLWVFDRANLEAWVFMSIGIFVYYYNNNKYYISLIFLSIAISLKLFPAIFIVLFFVDKRYLLIIYTFAISIIMNLISAILFKGGIHDTIKGMFSTFSDFSKRNIISSGSSAIQHNISIWAPLKLLYYNILTKMHEIPFHYEQIFNKYYVLFAFVFFVIISFCMIRYSFSFWKKVSLLLLTSILLQQSSYDYKLINVFVSIILFINTDEVSKFDFLYATIFGFLLIPKDYYLLADDISIAVIINPLLILTMIFLIIFEGIKKGETINFKHYLSFNKKLQSQDLA